MDSVSEDGMGTYERRWFITENGHPMIVYTILNPSLFVPFFFEITSNLLSFSDSMLLIAVYVLVP